MKSTLTAAIAAAGVFVSISASGETLDVTWTYIRDGATHTEATWRQDSKPTPHFHLTGDGTSVPVWDFVSSAFPPSTFVAYYNQSGPNSGLMFSTSFGSGLQLRGSQQLYAGGEAAPVFAAGSFSGFIYNVDQGIEVPSTLTFSVAVPEFSTWVLLLAGFAGLGALRLAHRRRALIA
jgi:hypothetical protein